MLFNYFLLKNYTLESFLQSNYFFNNNNKLPYLIIIGKSKISHFNLIQNIMSKLTIVKYKTFSYLFSNKFLTIIFNFFLLVTSFIIIINIIYFFFFPFLQIYFFILIFNFMYFLFLSLILSF